jgi:membrane protease YdiL (CAAX protease family)
MDQTKKIWQFVGVLIGAGSGLILVWTFDPAAIGWSPIDAAAPPASLRLTLLIFLCTLLSCINGIAVRRKLAGAAAQRPSNRLPLRRPKPTAGRAFLIWQLLMAAMLFAASTPAHWTYETVGLASGFSIAGSMVIGVATYAIFVLCLTKVVKAIGLLAKVSDRNLQILASLWPRQKRQRLLAVVAFCVMNPVIEELMYRGILVRQLGLSIDSVTIAIVIGLIAHLANHAYQGLWGTFTHLPFYIIVVTLLYSPAGLWGAIGFHFAGDLYPFLTLKRQMRQYRNRHRRVAGSEDVGVTIFPSPEF